MIKELFAKTLYNRLIAKGINVKLDGSYLIKHLFKKDSTCVNFTYLQYWCSSKSTEKSNRFNIADPDILERLERIIIAYE